MKLSPQPHSPEIFGISEAERLVQAILDEIDLGAIDERQCIRLHNDLDALVFEYHVRGVNLVRIVDDIGVAGAARLGNAEAQPDASLRFSR